MYLKSLTVLGFKSFADKTHLNFMPGITAIVGPNGCGKSNVADSIRWVLGEQSAKALRGGEMSDVIFNGTDSRKPLSMAEVSMTIGDVDEENLRAAGVELAYNEITLTRRVFRDGSSEYFINKTPCRLRDIQQLFMGTGVGRTSYSIMAQGHITQLLSSRPDDRRLVFEEAAGITRFKSQKKEALRKLESTDQNLLRVSDLIREVKRQIGSLQRQAGKARRYKQYMVELQHLETQLARHQYDVLQEQIGQRRETAEKLRIEMEVCSEALLRDESEVSQLRERMTVLEQQVSQSQQRGMELKGQMDHHESRIHFDEQRLAEQDQANSKALADIAQSEERKLAAEQELETVKGQLASATQGIEQLRVLMQTKREALQQVENDLKLQQETLRRVQSEAFGVAQQLTRLRNEINALDLQKQGNIVRLEKLSSEKIQLEEERGRLEARLAEFAMNVEAERMTLQTQRGTVEEQQARLRQLQPELNQITRELDESLRQQAGLRSKLNVLEQLQASHEGFSAGTLAALKQAPHMLGALVDKIRVPDAYIVPLEAALGHHLQLVLTDQPETAQQILTDLRANRRGRASIAALALQKVSGEAASVTPMVPAPDAAQPGTPAVPGVAETSTTGMTDPSSMVAATPLVEPALDAAAPVVSGESSQAVQAGGAGIAQTEMNLGPGLAGVSALSVIEVDETVRPLLERLLGRILIVADLDTATKAWREREGEWDIVTMNGEFLSRHGVYSGGSGNGTEKTAASILGRKNQIAELETQLTQLQERVNESSRKKGALQSEQTALQASLQQAQTELRAQEVSIATHQGEFKALENAARLLHQKIDTVVFEIQSLAELADEGVQKRNALAEQVAGTEQRDHDLQQQLADTNARIEALRQERDVAQNALSETKISLATEEQLANSFKQQQQTHEQRIHELAYVVDVRRQEIQNIIDRRAQFQAEIEESRMRIDSLRHEREQASVHTADLIEQKKVLEADITQRDEGMRDRRRRLTEVQQQKGTLEVELAQKTMSIQNLCEKIQQKYQIKLEDIRGECITITIVEEGPPKVETVTPSEMAERGLATDWDQVASQVEALQQRIDEMGPVNLVAIEEYEETEQRFQFLSTQHDDLVKAKEQLLEVINRINTQTREMFLETFAKVRENFSVLFTEIFGGGKADLLLINEADVLDSGIDIMARPPGKQLKSITLLSGGEQTMTAVALLFAIYQVKPSPFCVLDELDAPLDESNVNRFIGVLKRFQEYSQFVMITHNKRTIGMADVIYGVTMQEQGVSKMVSMKFHKSSGTLSETPAVSAPLAPPSHSMPMADLAGSGRPTVGSVSVGLKPATGETVTTPIIQMSELMAGESGRGNGNGNGHASGNGSDRLAEKATETPEVGAEKLTAPKDVA